MAETQTERALTAALLGTGLVKNEEMAHQMVRDHVQSHPRGVCACGHTEIVHGPKCQADEDSWACRCPKWEPLRTGEEYLAMITEARRVARQAPAAGSATAGEDGTVTP